MSKRLGLLRRRASARGGRRADGAAVAAGADRHVAAGRGHRQPRTSSRTASISPISAARRPISTSHDVELLNARLLHHLDFADGRRPPAGRRDRGRLAAAARRISRISANLPIGCAVLDGDIEPPELSHDERAVRARSGGGRRGPRLGRRAVARADRGAEGLRPAARAARCSCRCAWRSPAAKGPEMAPLLARIGKDRAVARLKAAATD